MRRIILLILAVFIVFSSADSCLSAPKKKIKKTKPKEKKEIKYTGFSSKRDPFSPPAKVAKMLEAPDQIPGAEMVAKDVKLPKVELQGIIWSKRVPQVIANNSVMSVGDFIEEFEIKEIRKTGIILFFKGNDYFIKTDVYTQPKKKR